MKIVKLVVVVLVVALLGVALMAPIGPLPGIFIGGAQTPVPAAWGATGDVDEIQLQVGEGLIPRVVIIWVIQVGGDLHVVGAADSGWTKMVGQGGPVRMRVGDETYDLQADQVTAGWQPVLEAYVEKYRGDYPEIIAGFPSVEEAEGTISVLRLTARGAS